MSVHQAPDPRAREGVPLQHVPDQGAAVGGGGTLESDRATGQDLVPEQAHEDEEADEPREEGDEFMSWR